MKIMINTIAVSVFIAMAAVSTGASAGMGYNDRSLDRDMHQRSQSGSQGMMRGNSSRSKGGKASFLKNAMESCYPGSDFNDFSRCVLSKVKQKRKNR